MRANLACNVLTLSDAPGQYEKFAHSTLYCFVAFIERLRMINWPVVIKFDGDDELAYVGSEEEWMCDAESQLYNHKGDDYLIDSSGHIFSLEHMQDGIINAESTCKQIQLQDFIRLVRIHASNSHRCCIEKINFRNIAEGISLVASMNDDN
jgi:hypothetical protein